MLVTSIEASTMINLIVYFEFNVIDSILKYRLI